MYPPGLFGNVPPSLFAGDEYSKPIVVMDNNKQSTTKYVDGLSYKFVCVFIGFGLLLRGTSRTILNCFWCQHVFGLVPKHRSQTKITKLEKHTRSDSLMFIGNLRIMDHGLRTMQYVPPHQPTHPPTRLFLGWPRWPAGWLGWVTAGRLRGDRHRAFG